MPIQPGETLQKKYRIESIIGEGAFGRVYLAHDLKLDRDVAIKELHKSTGGMSSEVFQDYADRFAREAKVQARFNHPNIVHVYELLNPRAEILYLVMEYVDGGSLKQLLERQGRLPLDEALRLGGEMLAGLAGVHADMRDIVHRDLKPSNLLLTRDNHIKISDFGLAQVGDESLRSVGGKPQPGTPAYMSPEQETTSAYLYPSSDIFSVGCTLFEMVTGLGYKQARRRKQSLRDLCPDVPDWLEQALNRLLVIDPNQRPQDGKEAAELLKKGMELEEAAQQVKKKKEQARLKKAAEKKEKVRLEVQQRKAQAATAEKARLAEEQARQKKAAEDKEKARLEAERKAQTASQDLTLTQKTIESALPILDQYRRAQAASQDLTLTLAPGVSMEFVRIPAGEFWMGSDPTKDKLARQSEQPQHKVHLDKYLMGKYPVTNRQYQAFVEASKHRNPGHWKDGKIPQGKEDHPVVYVTWQDGVAFCEWASRVSGKKVRLPTEAEWEKAARGTDRRIYPWGDQAPDKTRCNYNQNEKDTTPVGRYSPAGDSPYGCVDMAGNVFEWVNDWYGKTYYSSSPASNPPGPSSGDYRVLRGGSWNLSEFNVRSSNRGWSSPVNSSNHVGFRCSRSLP